MWTAAAAPSPPVAPPRVKEPQPTFPAAAVIPTLVGIAVSVVLGRVLSELVFDHVWESPSAYIAGFYLPLFGGVALTCVLVGRRFGTGRLSQDFGWSFRWGDLWRGPLVYLAGSFAAVITAAAAVASGFGQLDAAQRSHDAITHGLGRLPIATTVEFAIAGVVLAPLFEELAFRGVLQRALTERFDIGWAIALQALCFGAYHFTPGSGINASYMLGLAAFGAVAGLAAMRWKHLGVGMVAHAIANSFWVIAIVAAR